MAASFLKMAGSQIVLFLIKFKIFCGISKETVLGSLYKAGTTAGALMTGIAKRGATAPATTDGCV